MTSQISTPEWVKDSVFYQIFPDRYARDPRVEKPSNLEPWETPPTTYGFKGGDLLGVTERLDYLQELGVTAIYFNPVFKSAANHRYHTWDYYQVDPILGGNQALKTLLDAAHARGIRVVLDGVFNHASRGFYQFYHTMENGPASPYLDWFYFDVDRLRSGRPLNGYPDDSDEERLLRDNGSLRALGYQAWWDLPALPKFNTSTPAVRKFLLDVACHWVELGIDGWRLDVPGEIDDDEFWREFRRQVKAVNAESYLVGEIWADARRWLSGDQFDGVMNYPLNRACLGFFGGDRLDVSQHPGGFTLKSLDAAEFADEIDRLLSQYHWEIDLAQLNLLSSHDQPRFLTLVGQDKDALKLAVLFQMTYPGAPCIYYGDEIGMEGKHDPDCRRSFPWNEERWDHDLLTTYRRATTLRHEEHALRRGRYLRLLAGSKRRVYAFARQVDGEVLVVIINNEPQPYEIDVPTKEVLQEGAVLHDLWGDCEAKVESGRIRGAMLAARSGAVLKA